MALSYKLTKKGQINLPGITNASKTLTEDLLLKDAQVHHCFFNTAGFHNHLSHHMLAAYDLGAPATHLQRMYDEEAKEQRPIILDEKDKSIQVNKDNWIQCLGNHSAYHSFVGYFTEEIKAIGVPKALEKYVFSDEANAQGVQMLVRVVSGAIHPLILLGYGAEFGNDTLIATGLAQAACHKPGADFHPEKHPPTGESISLLQLLSEVYSSDKLKPLMPYDPNAFINARTKAVLDNGGHEELERLCARYPLPNDVTDAAISQTTEEIIWLATLLTFATGKKGRKPRLDFFLMHALTSSLFLRPLCAVLENSAHKAALLRVYVPNIMLYVCSRGRPRIDPELIMSYTDVPRPPNAKLQKPVSSSLGSPLNDGEYDPWPALIAGVLYHPDAHTIKSMRTLIYGAQHFGTTAAAKVPGAFRNTDGKAEETHVGMGKVDGTIFVRAAGVLMDTLGWVADGQEEGQWDRSALGWEAAWENGD
ncbi:hypothetical protein CPC08DRAFT_703825 [Agrocybe pediades]|nr:hypothetical protein CPC08DRAFT_703825 [Agrocybe pediades]